MEAIIKFKNQAYKIDLSEPLDISIPLHPGKDAVRAWYADPPRIEARLIDGRPGRVAAGASVNFNDISFNPHAHGTHTESVGHITREMESVNRLFHRYFFKAILITLAPETYGEDRFISSKQLEYALEDVRCEAVVLRTLPNTPEKLRRNYSNTNPPYLHEEAARYLAVKGISHLLIDLPSVDKEKDGGALLAHRAFWNTSGPVREASITEMIYVPNEVADGNYFLELQLASFENDASPSRPVLYKILKP